MILRLRPRQLTSAAPQRAARSHHPNIDQALADPHLLGAALGRNLASWSTWRTTLKAAFALGLNEQEAATFVGIAGSRSPPAKRVRELWVIVGRRGGKSRMAALIAVYCALFKTFQAAPGERLLVLVLSATVEQSRSVFQYAQAFLRESAVLRSEIMDDTNDEIRLRNGVVIGIHTNSFRSIRGPTLLACVFDETAFWRDDTTATPDTEVYSAVLPSLATCNGILVGISSPYRRAGLLHAKHKQYFGTDSDDTLVVQGSSQTFNNTLTDEVIAAQRLADPTGIGVGMGGEFRADLVGFLDDATLERAVNRTRPLELPPRQSIFYRAHVDASGGAINGDSYSICISHREADKYVVDLVRGRQGPFNPAELTREYSELCREYRIETVVGDLYGAQWVQQSWRDNNMSYVASDLNASQLYLEALPLFTRGLVELPDHPALLRELRLLERIPGRVGKTKSRIRATVTTILRTPHVAVSERWPTIWDMT
jgi:hypothetical protein